MADATPKPPAQTFIPWIFVNEGLRAPLAKALAHHKADGADPDQLAAITTAAIAELNAIAPEFNGAQVRIECQCNPSSRQATIIVMGKKILA